MLAPSLVSALETVAPTARIQTHPADVDRHAHDWWSRSIMRRRAGETLDLPAAVVAPADRDELAAVVAWCHEQHIAIVPFGAGTGVCGGASPVPGGITIDLKRINRVLEIDEVSGLVTAEPGIILQDLEERLLHRGWTLGHHPSSAHCSTLGGFLAIRSAGQESSFYGKMEDMVDGLEVVLPDGTVARWRSTASSSSGPDLKRLFLGSEGTFGIITEATLRIWPAPEVDVDRGFLFPDIPSGLAAIRALMRTGLRPHIFRLYDQTDTAMVFSGQGLEVPDGCLSILGASGTPEIAGFVAETGRRIMMEHGAEDLGEGPGQHWRENRHRVSYRYADYMKPGGAFGDALMLDTMEVAATWSRIEALYAEVKAALSEHADLVMAHISHVYPQGSSIYFTFGGITGGDEDAALRRYDAAWDAGARASLRVGGTMSHHHGVGLVRAPHLPTELGEGAFALLERIKDAIDPAGLANPGKLGLGTTSGAGA